MKRPSIFDKVRQHIVDAEKLFEGFGKTESTAAEEFETFMESKSAEYMIDGVGTQNSFHRVRRNGDTWEVVLTFKAPIKASMAEDGRRLSGLASNLIKIFISEGGVQGGTNASSG